MSPMWKKTVIVAGAVLTLSTLAYLYLQTRVYHPVVHMSLPEGLRITAVLGETKERKACEAKNARFLRVFKQCKDCKVMATSCDHSLEGTELALREGTALPYPVVVAGDSRVAFVGPPEMAKQSCQVAATQIAKADRAAECRAAQQPANKS